MRSRHTPIAALALALAAVALVAAGCGGGAGSPGVASVASPATAPTTTQSASGAQGPAESGSPGSQGGQFSVAMRVGDAAQGAKFAACMRKHGVQNFPDPNGQGVIHMDSSMGINPRSPAFQSAQSACRKLLPNGGQPSPQQKAKAQKQMLAFSKCMRAHGIKDFPDPTFSNGHVSLSLRGGPGSDLDPNSPTFQAARKACRGILPGLPTAKGSTSGGGSG